MKTATIGSSCLSVGPYETIRLPLAGFHKIRYLKILLILAEKIQLSLKSDKNNGYLAWSPTYF